MRLQDAIYNWLQIKLVADARPDDLAARETEQFFAEILTEDHKAGDVRIAQSDETKYYVEYVFEGELVTRAFDREAADQLLSDIESNPKYNE